MTEIEFEDWVSEGYTVVLKAIDKFDFARGFRFGTYATHSVQRHFYRVCKRALRRGRMEVGASIEHLNELPSEDAAASETGIVMSGEQEIDDLLSRMNECLNDREQFIIQERFGIGNDGVARTLRDVAEDIDLSKERVRQIQIHAVGKLRRFFGKLRPDLLTA